MKKTTKKYLSVGIAALITAIVIGILIAVWRYKPSLPENIAKTETESPSAMPTESSGPIVTVTQDNELPSSLIRFSETQGFIPEKLTLAQDAKGTGCLLVISNDSSQKLIVRVSPYTPEDNRGVRYDPIPPHSTSIIDARYNMSDISLHNRENPTQEFSLHFDKSCL